MSGSGTIDVADADALTGAFQSRDLGELRTMQIVASTFRLTRDPDRAARVPRDHVLINLLEAGSFSGRLAGRKLTAGPGDLVLSRLINSMDVVLDNARWLALLAPRVVVERHLRWETKLDGCVFAAGTVQATILGGLVRSLCALPDTLPPREVARATASSLTLLAACLGGSPAPARHGDDDKEIVAKSIRRFIAQRLSDPALDVDLICREFGLSRSRLYRVMGETGDVATIIRRLRLQAIAADIASRQFDHLSLAAVARSRGLMDERSFRRAFTREFGCAPSALRGGDGAVPLQGPIGADLQHWMLGL